MKKITIVILLLAMSPLLAARDGKFFAGIGAAALFPGDGRFKELYGSVQLSPELRVGYNLYRNFYFWLGGSFISASGVIPDLEEKIQAKQTFISLGAGWETRRSRHLQADLGAALLLAGFREKAMGSTTSKWAPGFDVRAGLRYFLKEKLFLGVSLGYAGAWTTARTEAGTVDIILGGMRLGGQMGLRF
jgi:hypothetical protein